MGDLRVRMGLPCDIGGAMIMVARMRGIFLSTAANEELNLEPFRILKNHKGRHGAGGFHLGAEG